MIYILVSKSPILTYINGHSIQSYKKQCLGEVIMWGYLAALAKCCNTRMFLWLFEEFLDNIP